MLKPLDIKGRMDCSYKLIVRKFPYGQILGTSSVNGVLTALRIKTLDGPKWVSV